MTERLLSLAAGVCPEVGPADFVAACADAGWAACGVWFDASTWDDRVAREVRRRLDDTGVVALDVEPVFVTPDGDHGDRIVDAAAELGARHVLVVSRGVDVGTFTERFASLCDRAAPAGIGCSVEFLAMMSVRSLAEAVAVVSTADRPNGAVLVDNLHLARTGSTPGELTDLDPALLPYAQLCDGPAEPGDDLLADALDHRCPPGEGGLPVADFLAALPPTTHLSLEVRSAALRRDHPDPVDRARRVLTATTTFLAQHQET